VNFTFTLLEIINKEQIAEKEKFISYFLILGKRFFNQSIKFSLQLLLTIFQTKNKYSHSKTNSIINMILIILKCKALWLVIFKYFEIDFA